ncbi:MAG: fibronectin type III domain-containing protein [Tidjanibacter sp.]|nr:fibronectin type III domain-containing protein [Tidjanibacter sp.]
MKKLRFLGALLAALCVVGCAPEITEEPTPEPLVAPTGVAVTATTTTTIALKWGSVEGAKGYEVRCKSASGYFSTKSDTTVATISGLTKSTDYQLAVRATDGERKSPWSEYVAARTADKEDVGGGGNDDQGGNDDNQGGTTPDLPDDPVVTPQNPDNSKWMLPSWENDGVVRAFPGAEGGGMYTTGGRGGKVLHVTNLNDNGEGSFRWAVSQSGARTIVFDVAGTIHLKSDISIRQGNLTIAGQTAPGGGICIAGGTVNVSASNIIIRYVRFRLGDEGAVSDGSDTTWGRYNSDIILDHCSMSWSIDEVSSYYANKNFTMQWCLLAEALNDSKHNKGNHGYGGIWGGRNASFHHNLLAHNNSRNPRFDHPEVYGNYVATHRGNSDYRNNVVYNWGDNSTYGGEGAAWNVVGNYYKPGPASKQRKYFVDANGIYSSSKTDYGYATMHVSGNYHAGSYATAINSDNWSGIYLHDGSTPSNYNSWKSTAQLPIRKNDTQQCFTTTHTVQKAFEQVLAHVGASHRRDSVDERIVGEAKSGKATYGNGIINSQSTVGGWPTLSASAEELARVKDTDGDGMPDWFESEVGTDKNSAADGNHTTLDKEGRYTNLEIYLHYLVREQVAAQCSGGTYEAIR